MTKQTNPMTYMRLAITLLMLIVFGLAALDKWMEGTAPQWFIDQFSDTWMGNMPQTPMFLSIAVLETVIALGAIVSLVKMEWLGSHAQIMRWTLVLVLFVFVMLGFGARVSGEFSAAADHFMYFAGTLLMLFMIDREDQPETA